jgi:integrase
VGLYDRTGEIPTPLVATTGYSPIPRYSFQNAISSSNRGCTSETATAVCSCPTSALKAFRSFPDASVSVQYSALAFPNMSTKDSTYEEYERALTRHVYPVLGSRPMARLRRKDMKDLVSRLKKNGLSRSSIRNIFAPIRAMFNQAIEDEELNFHPAANIGKLNKNKKSAAADEVEEVDEKKVFTMGEVGQVLEMDKETAADYYPVIACGFLSGLRMGEQIALRVIDLDFSSHVISGEKELLPRARHDAERKPRAKRGH